MITEMATKFLLRISLVLTFLLGGCSNSTQIEISDDTVILAFGDSLTEGYGAPEGNAYPEVLARILGVKVLNAGVSGETSAQGLARLPALLDAHQPDILILITGGNDILRNQSKAQLKTNLIAMIQLAQSRNIDVLMASVPEKALFLSSNQFYLDVAEEMNVPIAQDLLADLLSDQALKSDSVHLNAEGYKKMAEGLAEFFQ